MSESRRKRDGNGHWAERSTVIEFNDEVRGLNAREEVEVSEKDEIADLRLDLEPNPFLLGEDERDERTARKVRELESRFEQEIQEIDEAELAAASDPKNQVFDRMLPGRARTRAENYADARDARMTELGMSLAELDYEEYGAAQPSNDQASVAEEEQEARRKGIELEI